LAGSAGEVPGGRLGHLRGGGKMDEAVALVERRAAEQAGRWASRHSSAEQIL